VLASTVTTTFHHPFYDITEASFVDAVDLNIRNELQILVTTDGVGMGISTGHTRSIRPTTHTDAPEGEADERQDASS
jgi:hypothetical protein